MRDLPDTVRAYRRTTKFPSAGIPPALLNDHETKEGVWGVINVVSGSLRYHIPSRNESHMLRPGHPGIVEPTIAHRVEPIGDATFFIEFYR
ncbi:MAG: DUF1971 domain-containing protein [Alphaproteobacteria bacterium]